MSKWILIFFVFSVIAAFFGFGGLAAPIADLGQSLFYISLCLFVISIVNGIAFRGDKFANTSF